MGLARETWQWVERMEGMMNTEPQRDGGGAACGYRLLSQEGAHEILLRAASVPSVSPWLLSPPPHAHRQTLHLALGQPPT